MANCEVCGKETDQCCGLCRKAFYCSPEHQEFKWHTTHKYSCQGKKQQQNVLSNHHANNEFRLYNQSMVKSEQNTPNPQTRALSLAKVFVSLYQERLLVRKSLFERFMQSSPEECRDCAEDCEKLVELSEKVKETYHVSMHEMLLDSHGIDTNEFLLKVDLALDKVLLARCYLKAQKHRPLKELLLGLGEEVEPYPQDGSPAECDHEVYRKLLRAVIDVAEAAKLDKVAEKMLANFMKLVEKFDGTWEQIYAYFHMGVWYVRKTYFHKAIKCFSYSLDMISSHKAKDSADNSAILKADLLFNRAQSRHVCQDHQKAFQDMHEAYRLRVSCIGKNCIETSECLYWLSQWSLQEKSYEVCLEFVQECLRIRKANSEYGKELAQVKELIQKIYADIKQEKDKQFEAMNAKEVKYYDKLLQEAVPEEQQERPSFTKAILDQKDQVVFKFHIDEALADTITSEQWKNIGVLIDMVDKPIDRQEAIRLILESDFTNSLSEPQKTAFIKLNRIEG